MWHYLPPCSIDIVPTPHLGKTVVNAFLCTFIPMYVQVQVGHE